MRAEIVPGALFPDYELSDHTGKHRKLSELQALDPMVLILSYATVLTKPFNLKRSTRRSAMFCAS
jgi:hypothetical protein